MSSRGRGPLRIALATRRYPPLIGGAEVVLSYLARSLAAAGAEVTVLTSRLDPTTPSRETPCERLTVERLATSPLRFVGTWRYMRNLRRRFAAHAIDIAYVSMLKHDAYVTVDAGRRLGFPVVLRPEGAGETGDIAWQHRGRFGRRIAERCRTADAFVAISAAVREELIGDGYDAARIHDLPNGVPIPERAWTPRVGPPAPPDAVYVGRLAREKGLDTLIAAWPAVLADRPEARLTLIGDGPERARLEAQVAALGLGGRVALPGATTDAAARLREFDLFILPSREEGMSIALLEAMALGMPLVASDIPGNRRLVIDGEHGRLAPADDPRALARAVLDRWSDAERSIAMAAAARESIDRSYSIDAVARRHIELFERLIAARR